MSEEDTEARDKLQQAIEEYIKSTNEDEPMLLAASLVYETTRWNGEDQTYRTEHVMFGTAAVNAHIGLLVVVKDRLLRYMNRVEE